MKKTEEETFINEFAIRSFRDVGDFDYVAARMAYRAKLYPQFLWSGQQTIEKYLKCVLLLNRIKAPKIGHNLSKSLKLVEQHLSFKFRLSDESRKTIEYFDTYGLSRYFETPYHVNGEYLIDFDRAIWELRRYCRTINYDYTSPDGTKKSVLNHELMIIEKSEKLPPQSFKRINGKLEELIADKKHPAREFVIWKNQYFGTQIRKTIKIRKFSYSANSPLSLTPEILDNIQQYVHLSKEVVKGYKQVLHDRTKQNNRVG